MKLVLVHLGTKLPDHLFANFRYLKKNFPQLDTTILVDDLGNADRLKKRKMEYEIIEMDKPRRSNSSDKGYSSFRGGFWRLTIERFLAIDAFHKNNPDSQLLHIENDVLLLPSFSPKKLSGLMNMHWLSYTHDSDSAAVFYSPSYSKTHLFISELQEIMRLNPGITDMRALFEMRKMRPRDFQVLPSLENDHVIGNELISTRQKWGQIYDPALLGMWLFGEDPMNNFGATREHFIRGEKVKLPFNLAIKDGKLLLRQGVNEFEVVTLHAHSKNADLFSAKWIIYAKKSVENSLLDRHAKRLYPRVTFKVLRDYYRRRKIHTLVLLIPGAKKLFTLRRMPLRRDL